MYSVKFHKEVEKDLEKLDATSRILFTKTLGKILQSPELGKDLRNTGGIDLSGYKKMYFDGKKKRIVYKVKEKEVIVYIISVGKREKMDVYKEAFKRK
ncbi:hypothetical protein AUK10_02280 [Candidatus Gracilibacteria bacterium CG2_30_37_12]|nr:MAG: hypothetical protein AUK10_02280 [Candidatus Gracilibacteria bacterium CG2_30_37_12]